MPYMRVAGGCGSIGALDITSSSECSATGLHVGARLDRVIKIEARSHYQAGCSICGTACSQMDVGALFFNRRNESQPVNERHASICRVGQEGARRAAHRALTLPADSATCRAECSAFCKRERSVNHCKLCRCAACTFCSSGSRTSGLANTGSPGRATALPAIMAAPAPVQHAAIPRPLAVAVTSVFLPHLAKSAAASPPYAGTLFGRPLPLPLLAYYDGGDVDDCPQIGGTRWIALDVAAPWAGQFVRHMSQTDSPLQSAYRHRRLTCVVRATGIRASRGNKTAAATSSCKDVLTAYKVAAIAHAMAHHGVAADPIGHSPTGELHASPSNGVAGTAAGTSSSPRRRRPSVASPSMTMTWSQGSKSAGMASVRATRADSSSPPKPLPRYEYLLWLDVDVFGTARPLDSRFWSWVTRFDIATIGNAPPHHPETGVIAIRIGSPPARELARRAAALYDADGGRANNSRQPDGSHATSMNSSTGGFDAQTGWTSRFLPSGGANDIQVFGHLIATMALDERLVAGWFAVGCRPEVRQHDDPLHGLVLLHGNHTPGAPAASAFATPPIWSVATLLLGLLRPVWCWLRAWASGVTSSGAMAGGGASCTSTSTDVPEAEQVDQQWVLDSRSYEARRFHLCPASTPDASTSPFNLLEYLIHLKSQAGPTAFRKIG